MKRGPAPGTIRADRSFAEKAADAWGAAEGSGPPDWVIELAALADAHGLRGAEKRVGYSASAISTVINRRYRGDLARVEEMVRGALIRVTLWRACRTGCPHSNLRPEEDT